MSNDGEGLDEFMERIEESAREEDFDDRAVPAKEYYKDEDCEKTEAKKEEDSEPGKPCQYALFASGFMATTKTIPKLPVGCYKIRASNQGLWVDPVKIITDALLRLPDSMSDQVIDEVEQFWGLKSTFAKYGFSHKRGFLLWGPPGSGKTCTIAILIEKMIQRGGIVLIADHPGRLAGILPEFRSVEPERPLVVIWEDLDSVVEQYGEPEVLAILDGESQVDNVVFIATTNYPEKLDARICNRPSRFDRIIKIDMPNDAARAMYLKHKTKTAENPEGTTLAPDGTDLVSASKGYSIAHLRELIIGIYCLGNKPANVIKRLDSMKKVPKSGLTGSGMGLGMDQ